MSKPKPLDKDSKAVWEQTKKLKSSKIPSQYLATLGDPAFVQTQVVAGINYRFTFKNGMQVTVNSTPWRQDQPLSIVNVGHSQSKITKAAKPSDTAGMQLTQQQRENAVKQFQKQDINHDGSIPNGAAYTALMALEGAQPISKKCPGWEDITQKIVDSNKGKKGIRIDDFMAKYTDFEVARRGMKYFSAYAGKDCVLTGKELEDGIRKTFGNGITKDQVKDLIAHYSQDKNPNVSFQEFYTMYKDYEESTSDKPNQGKGDAPSSGTLKEKETNLAEKAWSDLDKSKDGFVQNSEFSAKFRTIVQTMESQGKGSKELLGYLKTYFSYFAGKDGKLSHVEFLKMMEVMKSKVGEKVFDQFLDTLTASNCGQLKDCYKCVSADLACAWVPAPSKGRTRGSKKDGTCVESKTASFTGSMLLRGAPVSSPLTSRSQCGMKYDAQPHIYDGIMPPSNLYKDVAE